MHMYRLALGITIGLMVTVATGWAADSPKENKIHSTFACSFVPSTFDNNGDGLTAGLNQCTGKGDGGPFTSQGGERASSPSPGPCDVPTRDHGVPV